jgi:hypothetical protein
MRKSFMKENGEKVQISEKERAYKYGKMGQSMKAGGKITKPVVEVD